MQIPRSYIEAYSNALNVVSDRARSRLVDALSRIDYAADVASVREAVIAVMQPACGASAAVAARMAAEFYDGLRVRFGIVDGFAAQAESLREPEATDGAVRAFAQDLVDGKPAEQFIGKCADRIDYETRRAANECIAYNARNDPKKPRWARIPAGAETCGFCIMLASRGFVYHSEETASHAHARCDCRVVPSWDKSPAAQGYDPDLYYDMWKHPEKYERKRAGEIDSETKRSSEDYAIAGVKYTNHMERLHRYAERIEPMPGFEDVVIHSDGVSFAWKDLNADTLQEGEIEITAVALGKMLKNNQGYNGGNIRLISCSAGRYENGAAQMLADYLGVDVYAPIEDLRVDKYGKMIAADEDLDDIPEYKLDEEYQKSLWRVFRPGAYHD